MVKQKVPTPQELYRARKQAQEAYFPPGLVNQGNTCFMNSVLQGLIATPLLADLVQFHDIPDQVQKHSNTPLIPRRSPQLTNGHGRGGVYERPPMPMPIGDQFVDIMYHAWDIQSERSRENLNPKELLAALGQKYEQYLDFAQQDAHEFLRFLLDAMRMEELDIIKQRQPPLLKQPRKRRRSSRQHPSSPTMHSNQPLLPAPSPSVSESATLLSFPDMIFGGKLTSILVCQKCKNISQTYEDFNDLSLSLKAEDYAVLHPRTRDRFKKLAKKLAALPSTSLVASANPSAASNSREIGGSGPNKEDDPAKGGDGKVNTPDLARVNVALQIQRSSSVPPSPRERADPQIAEKLLPHLVTLRRSMEHLQSDMMHPLSGVSSSSASGSDSQLDRLQESNSSGVLTGNETKDSFSSVQEEHSPAAGEKEMESDGCNVIINPPALPRSISAPDKHVGFASADKPPNDHTKEKTKDRRKRDFEDGLAKLGRRISLRVGIGHKKDKDRGTEKEKEKHGKRSRSADRPISSSSIVSPAVTGSLEGQYVEKEQRNSKRNKSQDRRSNASSFRVSSSTDVDPRNSIPIKETPSIPDANSTTLSSSPGTAASIKISISSCDAVPNRSSQSEEPLPVIAEPQPVRSFSAQSQTLPRRGSPLHSMHAHIQRVSGSVRRSKSPKPPKPSKEEEEYIRRLLADVGPAQVRVSGGEDVAKHSNKKTHLQPLGGDRGSKAGNGNVGSWLPLAAVSQFSGLEECLRMFTAVEVLDGENMVGCRRCWKIQNGLIKGDDEEEDSADEEDEPREYEGETERQSTSRTIVSESSTSSVAEYLSTPATSVEGDDKWEKPEFKSTISSPNLLADAIPANMSLASDIDEPSSETPRPHSQSKSRNTEDETTLVTPRFSRASQSLPATPDSHRTPQYDASPMSPKSLPSTPGGLPIPLIATTPAVDSPTSEQFVSRDDKGVNDISSFDTVYEVGVGEEVITDDEAKKKRRGMVFSDSLIVPSKTLRRTARLERGDIPDEWLNSEAESVTTTDVSLDGSTGESEGSESRRGSLEEDHRDIHQSLATLKRGSGSTSVVKPPLKPKKKKETILRPAFKRYLIASPPPVLVIHLKRFQQLGEHSSSSSGHVSFAERFAAHFANPQTNAQYLARNNYGGAFGGFGGGAGFKKLEDFVSVPEWLDLTPFLAPKKEDIVSGRKSKSKTGGEGGVGEEKGEKDDERCMYRLYAVVVHIGNMLGGHYVSYVALPNQPSSYSTHSTKSKGKGESNSLPRSNSSSSTTSDPGSAKPALTVGLKSGKRQWAYISDTNVRLTSLEEVLRARAYLCMYERV